MKVNSKIAYNSKTFLADYLAAYDCKPNHLDPTEEHAMPQWVAGVMPNRVDTYSSFCIVQDSDMDGVMSAAIVYNWLKHYDAKVDVVWHTAKQHGLRDVLGQVIDTDADCIIVPDAGSSDVQEARCLADNDKRVVVLDHHEYEPTDNMPATVINCKDWAIGRNLSGGGVCAWVLNEGYDLAACSIVSDVMPLNDLVNRWMVKRGFDDIVNPFLLYLVDKLDKRYLLNGKPTPKWVGWTLAPLVNAVCRSDDQDAKQLMFYAFVNEADFDKALKVMRQKHRQQRDKIATLYDELVKVADEEHKFVVCMADADDRSYLGLAANRMLSKCNKPILVLRELDSTRWTGSVRSPIDTLSLINDSGYAECMGHERAHGITVKKSQLKRLLEWADGLDIDMYPAVDVACEMRPSDCTLALANLLAKHADLWWQGLPEPLFYSRITAQPSAIHVFRKATNTLRIDCDGMSFIKFGVSDDEANAIECGKPIDIELVYRLSINEYNGELSVQGMVDRMEWTADADGNPTEENCNIDDIFSVGR